MGRMLSWREAGKQMAKEMSNKELLQWRREAKQREQTNPGFYRGTHTHEVIRKEIAKRKATGIMKKIAGKSRTPSSPFGSFGSLRFRGLRF